MLIESTVSKSLERPLFRRDQEVGKLDAHMFVVHWTLWNSVCSNLYVKRFAGYEPCVQWWSNQLEVSKSGFSCPFNFRDWIHVRYRRRKRGRVHPGYPSRFWLYSNGILWMLSKRGKEIVGGVKQGKRPRRPRMRVGNLWVRSFRSRAPVEPFWEIKK